MERPRTVCLNLPAEANSLGRVRRVMGEFAGAFAPDVARKVLLAVNEAATNVVIHAYHDQPVPGPLVVSARVRDAGLTVEVCDAGPGVRAREDSPGMGAGMRVMASLSSRMDIEHHADGTCVRMLFATPTTARRAA